MIFLGHPATNFTLLPTIIIDSNLKLLLLEKNGKNLS